MGVALRTIVSDRPVLSELRNLPGVLPSPMKSREALPFSLKKGGLPRGSLIEISGGLGQGKTEALISFLAENRNLKTAWIESSLNLNPFCFWQNRVSLGNILFIEPETDFELEWAANQAVSSGLFQLVIVQDDRFSLSASVLRRIQIMVRKLKSIFIVLSSSARVSDSWLFTDRLNFFRKDGVVRCRTATSIATF